MTSINSFCSCSLFDLCYFMNVRGCFIFKLIICSIPFGSLGVPSRITFIHLFNAVLKGLLSTIILDQPFLFGRRAKCCNCDLVHKICLLDSSNILLEMKSVLRKKSRTRNKIISYTNLYLRAAAYAGFIKIKNKKTSKYAKLLGITRVERIAKAYLFHYAIGLYTNSFVLHNSCLLHIRKKQREGVCFSPTLISQSFSTFSSFSPIIKSNT